MGKVFMHDQSDKSTGAKTSNAKLTVHCPSGSTVTVTSGQNEYVLVSDADDKAIFYGLTHGTWNVVVNDGVQVYEQSIDITTDYELTLDFFSATINISYPYGSTCTCSNGTTTYTAPDTSGLWVCNIPCVGTWTLECTDGDLTKTETVDITYDGQEVSTSIEYFTATINVKYPNGAVCSCSNEGNIYSASDTSGSWTFTVHELAAWVIKVSDGIQTVTQVVSITTDGQIEDVTIRFFESTINITYPVGATCTCSDGITNFTAPDTSGTWAVTVPRIGIWRIEAVNYESSDVKTVDITADGQSVDVTCVFFTAYVNVVYPSGTFKVVIWYIDSYGTKVEKGIDTSGSGTHRFTVGKIGTYEVGSYRVAPYVGIESTAGDYTSDTAEITATGETVSIDLSYNTIPEFTYTGSYKVTDDNGTTITESTGNWMITFLTTGVFKASKLNGAKNGIDVFVLGGGGKGGALSVVSGGGYNYYSGGGGGGGGYRTNSYDIDIVADRAYEIVVGGAGGSSSAFDVSANAGSNGGSGDGGGTGGSGGSRGGDGGEAANDAQNGEDGARAFLVSTGYRYGGGGGGGSGYNGKTQKRGEDGAGGKDGGAEGGESATANTGGGGGGEDVYYEGSSSVGTGGSGIVIIRNKR